VEGSAFLSLCFRGDGPDTGMHPIHQEELRAAFNPSSGWDVVAIEPSRIQTRSRQRCTGLVRDH
jgi:hypothetical protein